MNTKLHETIEWSEIVLLAFVYALYILLVTAPIGFVISALKVYQFKRVADQDADAISHERLLIATHH